LIIIIILIAPAIILILALSTLAVSQQWRTAHVRESIVFATGSLQ